MGRRKDTTPRELSVDRVRGQGEAARRQVTFRVTQLEPRLSLALAAFIVWATVVLNPGDYPAMLLALEAVAVAAWCRLMFARSHLSIFLRGALLLAGAFMLQIAPRFGGPDGPYAIWPVMVVVIYTLLLPRRWTLALWALAVAEFVAVRAVSGSLGATRTDMVLAAILAVFAYSASEFGRAFRKLDVQAEQSSKDRGSKLYNEAGFFEHGGQLFTECRMRKRPFSIVLLNSADLREVIDVAGRKAANNVFAELVQSISAATPRDGLVARTDAAEFGIALPGTSVERAATLLREHLGSPPKVQVSLNGRKFSVILDVAIAEATSDVPNLEDMYDRLRVKLAKRTGEAPPSSMDPASTLQGMWQGDSVVPHEARPTMPMDEATLNAIAAKHG